MGALPLQPGDGLLGVTSFRMGVERCAFIVPGSVTQDGAAHDDLVVAGGADVDVDDDGDLAMSLRV
jgi:hypothetical protein